MLASVSLPCQAETMRPRRLRPQRIPGSSCVPHSLRVLPDNAGASHNRGRYILLRRLAAVCAQSQVPRSVHRSTAASGPETARFQCFTRTVRATPIISLPSEPHVPEAPAVWHAMAARKAARIMVTSPLDDNDEDHGPELTAWLVAQQNRLREALTRVGRVSHCGTSSPR